MTGLFFFHHLDNIPKLSPVKNRTRSLAAASFSSTVSIAGQE